MPRRHEYWSLREQKRCVNCGLDSGQTVRCVPCAAIHHDYRYSTGYVRRTLAERRMRSLREKAERRLRRSQKLQRG